MPAKERNKKSSKVKAMTECVNTKHKSLCCVQYARTSVVPVSHGIVAKRRLFTSSVMPVSKPMLT